MQYPASELEYWAAYFSIDAAGDKPIIEPEEISVEDSKAGLKRIWD